MKYGKDCVCGRGGECQGVSAAFALLKDPRRGYVQLPQYTANPRTYEQKDMNDMRASYLRHLRRTEESLGDSDILRFVALHHFHPVVVHKHSEMPGALSPIPKTVKKVDLKYLKMELTDEDRVRDADGRKRKLFYFAPTHRMDQAKQDLKHMIRVNRLLNEAKKKEVPPTPVWAAHVAPKTPPRQVASHDKGKSLDVDDFLEAEAEASASRNDTEVAKSPGNDIPPSNKAKTLTVGTTPRVEEMATTEEKGTMPLVNDGDSPPAHFPPNQVLKHSPSKSKRPEPKRPEPEPAGLDVTAPAKLSPKRQNSPKSPTTAHVISSAAVAATMIPELQKPVVIDEVEKPVVSEVGTVEVEPVIEEVEKLDVAEAGTVEEFVIEEVEKPVVAEVGTIEEEPVINEVEKQVEPEAGIIEEPVIDEVEKLGVAEVGTTEEEFVIDEVGKQVEPETGITEEDPVLDEVEKQVVSEVGATEVAKAVSYESVEMNSGEMDEEPTPKVTTPTEEEKLDDAPLEDIELKAAGSMADTEVSILSLASTIFSQEYDEEKLPAHLTMESEEGRRFLFRRICQFEKKRSAKCKPLCQEFAVRWRASLEVMQAGIFETARAERLVRGAALANQAYGEAMRAITDDVYMDDDLNLVTEHWKQKKLAKEREGVELFIETNEGVSSPGKSKKEQGSILETMLNSHAEIAGKFTDDCERINQEVVTELANLRSYLKDQMLDFKRKGDPFIRDIQGSETEIQTAFAVFEIVGPAPGNFAGKDASLHMRRAFSPSTAMPVQASGSFHGTPNVNSSGHGNAQESSKPQMAKAKSLFTFGRSRHGSNHGTNHGNGSSHGDSTITRQDEDEDQGMYIDPKILGNANSPFVGALRANAIVRDGWVIELFYREAVNNQVHILQQAGKAIEEIWQSMHNIEVNRQKRLHELMLDFMPRQRRLFLGLSPITGPILADLVEMRMELEELQDQVEETIQRRMQTIHKISNAQRSSIMNRSRAQAPNLEELQSVLTGEFFDNGLLHAAKIVERRSGRNVWKTSLAVVTSDNYLHLFELDAFANVSIGAAPGTVFEMLLPDYDIPTMETVAVERRQGTLLQNLVPVETVLLSKCNCTILVDDPRVVEVVWQSKGYLQNTLVNNRLSIRTTGREETSSWFGLLRKCQGHTGISSNGAGGGDSVDGEEADEFVT